MTDSEILSICFLKNGKINNNVTTERYLLRHNDIKDYLKKRYNDIPDEIFTYKEVLWRIKNNINERPVCKICKKPVSFIGRESWEAKGRTKNGYLIYCSKKCSNGDDEVKVKVRETNKRVYGANTPMLNDLVREKFTATMLKKYGTEHALRNKEILEKAKKTTETRYGTDIAAKSNVVKEKTKSTNLKRYGFVAPACSEAVMSKIKKTNAAKYGTECFLKSNEFFALREKNKVEWQDKATRGLIRTGKINKSAIEDRMRDLLYEIYGKENVEYQYSSKEYPFICDFFIKTEKIYIEYQGTYFHNFKLYDKDRDREEYEKLVLKSLDNNHPSYKRVINTWTIRDVEKYNVAKKNNIKIIFIYPEWSENWKLFSKGSKKVSEIDMKEDLKKVLSLVENNRQLVIGEKI